MDVAKIGIVGFLFLFVIIMLLLRNVEIAFNEIWQVSDNRSWWKRLLFFCLTVTLGALAISLIVTVLNYFGASNVLPFGEDNQQNQATFLSVAVNTLVTFISFFCAHKIAPNCHVGMKAALVGALTATVLMRLASICFGIYTRRSDWNENVYEALAVVPLFLLWLYVSWLVILISAIVAWRTQHGIGAQRANVDKLGMPHSNQ